MIIQSVYVFFSQSSFCRTAQRNSAVLIATVLYAKEVITEGYRRKTVISSVSTPRQKNRSPLKVRIFKIKFGKQRKGITRNYLKKNNTLMPAPVFIMLSGLKYKLLSLC